MSSADGPRRVKVDRPFRTDAEVREMVEQFAQCRWPYERWTHRAHLGVAVVALRQFPFDDALAWVRRHIDQYNRTCGDPAGYHETITVVSLRYVAHYLNGAGAEQSDAAAVEALFAAYGGMGLLLAYYSAERLWSAAARAGWVEPDRRPLDF